MPEYLYYVNINYQQSFLLNTRGMDIIFLTLCGGIAGFLKFYIIMLTLRVYLTWFPNINFFMQPFSTLSKLTDPYLRVFRGLIPATFGFDLSPLLGFVLLTFLIDIFNSVVA